jgi:hypothetical protein
VEHVAGALEDDEAGAADSGQQGVLIAARVPRVALTPEDECGRSDLRELGGVVAFSAPPRFDDGTARSMRDASISARRSPEKDGSP